MGQNAWIKTISTLTIGLLLTFPLKSQQLTKDNYFTVDSSFNYSQYSYYNVFGETKQVKETYHLKLSKLFAPYLIEQPSKFVLPYFGDGNWSMFPCTCKLDTTKQAFTIIQNTSGGFGGRFRSIMLTSDFKLSAQLKIEQDMAPIIQKMNASEIVLALNRNPFEQRKVLDSKMIVMDRIIEGYALANFQNSTNPYRVVFRCFIEVKGEEWGFNKKEK